MKNARYATRYKTHSLLLPSLPSPSSPLTALSPVFCARAYRRGDCSPRRASGASPATQSLHEASAPGGAVRGARRPDGTQAPGDETNGMQGPLIPFCGLCGREFEPQRTRRGEPKHFCSDACRARAWRRRDATQNAQNSQKSGRHPLLGNSVISVRHLEEPGLRLQAPSDASQDVAGTGEN